MADAKLTIKVGADVKKAAEELKALGYNIQDVKKETDKANNSASLWSQSLTKGSQDSIKQLVSLGAKFLTVTTVATAAYKGIKSCVQEALKENKEAAEQIDKINGAWSEIKKNLGTALLNSVGPALESLLKILNKISDWSKARAKGSNYNAMLADAETAYRNGSRYDVSGLSYDELIYATNNLPNNTAYTRGQAWIMQLAEDLVSALKNYGSSTTESTGATGLATRKSSSYKHPASTYDPEAAYRDIMDNVSSIHRMDEATSYITEAIEQYKKFAKEAANDDEKSYWENQATAVQEYIDKIKEARDAQLDLLNNISTVASSVIDLWSNITEYQTAASNREIANIEKSTASEEEKAAKIDEIKRKQFQSQKANALAEAAVSLAQAFLNIYKEYPHPAMRAVMYALTAASGAFQIGTIASQQYTSSLATGGIVSQPTHALIGEGAEKEAVMPLSKLEEFVERPSSSGTIILNITINGSRGGTAEDVYRAIERAQRTGALPAWRYASR